MMMLVLLKILSSASRSPRQISEQSEEIDFNYDDYPLFDFDDEILCFDEDCNIPNTNPGDTDPIDCDPAFEDCSILNTGATGDNHPNNCGPVDCGIPFPYCYQASENCSIPNAGPSEDCRPTPVSRQSAAKGPTVRMWVQSPNFPASYPNNANEV